jgi:hypothetical protein
VIDRLTLREHTHKALAVEANLRSDEQACQAAEGLDRRRNDLDPLAKLLSRPLEVTLTPLTNAVKWVAALILRRLRSES